MGEHRSQIGAARWRAALAAAAVLATAACGSNSGGRGAAPAVPPAGDAATAAASAPASSTGAAGTAQPESAAPAGSPPAAAQTSATPAAKTAGAASAKPGTGSSPAAGSAAAAKPAGTPAAATAAGQSGSDKPRAGAATPLPGGGAAPAPAPATGGPKAEVRLAVLGVASGPLGAVLKPVADGARAWGVTVNERGGLAGHPVKLLFADDGGDPQRALQMAKKFVEQDHVQAFYASNMITTEEAVTPYLEKVHVPIIGNCGCTTTTDSSPAVFQTGPGAGRGMAWAHMAGIVSQAKAHKVAVMYCREANQCKGVRDAAVPLAKEAGLDVVYEAQISIAQPDYTAEVIQARNAGAEAVITIVDNQTTIRFIRSAQRQGWKPFVGIQQSMVDDRMLGIDEAEGVFSAAVVPDYRTDPRLADYRAAIKRVPGSVSATIGANMYTTGQLLEKLAAQLPDNPSGEDFLRIMQGMRGETLGGVYPPLTYKSGVGHVDTNQCAIPVKIHDHAFQDLSGGQFVCAPGWKPVQL